MKYLFFAITVFLLGCSQYNLPRGTPKCITEAIKNFDKTTSCANAKVEQFDLNGKKYYAFIESTCCCDRQDHLYDADCNLVCTTGGIAGGGACSIDINALQSEGIIWEKGK